MQNATAAQSMHTRCNGGLACGTQHTHRRRRSAFRSPRPSSTQRSRASHTAASDTRSQGNPHTAPLKCAINGPHRSANPSVNEPRARHRPDRRCILAARCGLSTLWVPTRPDGTAGGGSFENSCRARTTMQSPGHAGVALVRHTPAARQWPTKTATERSTSVDKEKAENEPVVHIPNV